MYSQPPLNYIIIISHFYLPLQSLKETVSVLEEHEEALKQKLQQTVMTTQQQRCVISCQVITLSLSRQLGILIESAQHNTFVV